MSETQGQVLERPQTQKAEPDRPWLWDVVLLDDDEHSYEYVIRMMQELFAMGLQGGFKVAERVDSDGRAVCLTTHKEHAELKRDQVLAFGKDPLMMESKGSMTCVIEPSWGGDGDGDEDGA